MDNEPDLYLSDIESESEGEGEGNGESENGSIGDISMDNEPEIDVKGKKCWDVGLASEEDIEGFLAEDGDNIVMILEGGGASVCIDRESIKTKLIDDTDNYYYLCRGAYEPHDGQLPIGVGKHNVCEVPVFGLGFLGLASRGLVFRDNLANAVANDRDQVFVIKHFEPAVKASAVAGVSYLRAGPSGQGTIGSMHCQPDTGDEVYYVTAANANIVPADIQQTVETLLSAGCLVKKGEATLTQVAYDGKPASQEVEEKLAALKMSKDFPENDTGVETDDNAGNVGFDADDYLDTFIYSDGLPESVQTYDEAIADMLYELPRPLMPDLSPDANVALNLRLHAVDSLSPYVANYYVVLFNGVGEAESGLTVIQTTKRSPSSPIEYRLKPIIKIHDFPPSQPGEGVAFSEQTLTILETQSEEVSEKLRDTVRESRTDTDVTPVVEDVSVLMGQTNFHRKQDSLMACLLCVKMSRILAGGGRGFDDDSNAELYYSSADAVIEATEDYLRDSSPTRAFVVPQMPEGMELIQIKLSLVEPVFRITTSHMTRAAGVPTPVRSTSITDLGNVFTYLDIPTSLDDAVFPDGEEIDIPFTDDEDET